MVSHKIPCYFLSFFANGLFDCTSRGMSKNLTNWLVTFAQNLQGKSLATANFLNQWKIKVITKVGDKLLWRAEIANVTIQKPRYRDMLVEGSKTTKCNLNMLALQQHMLQHKQLATPFCVGLKCSATQMGKVDSTEPVTSCCALHEKRSDRKLSIDEGGSCGDAVHRRKRIVDALTNETESEMKNWRFRCPRETRKNCIFRLRSQFTSGPDLSIANKQKISKNEHFSSVWSSDSFFLFFCLSASSCSEPLCGEKWNQG